MRLNVNTAVIIIVATAVLHNVLKDRDVPPPEIENLLLEEPIAIPSTRENNDFEIRSQIIHNFF